MPTYKMTIEYDGTEFCGWQIQPEQPTVQEAIQDALRTALRRQIDVVGSGRTDAGVHARGQVAHFRVDTPIDVHRLLASLNGILPKSIAVRTIEPVRDGFHARYDAISRRYHYYVTTGFRALDRHMRWRVRPAPNFDRMNIAARDLVGHHDFDSFCITQSETKNRECTVQDAGWVPESDDGDWRFEIVADRFLHGMVRAIVGTLVEIGQDKRPSNDIERILARKDRREAGPAAPAFGLVLEKVAYPLVAILLIVLLGACERPFIEAERPEIEVVSPDLSIIYPNTKIQLHIRARGQRTIERILVDDDSLTFDPVQQVWVLDHALRFGLNRIVLAAIDIDGQVTFDTVYAMHGTPNVDRNAPSLPEPRGGHTATLTDDGLIYFIGGTPTLTSSAHRTGAVWNQSLIEAMRPLANEMIAARTGHTASLLPDGRILLLGGSRREPLESVQDLVETVEVFDPGTETFRFVAFEGAPIRRAYHTATVHTEGSQVFVDLYGGIGDIRYGSNPTLGIRDDIRRFLVRGDSLIALSPSFGASLDYALWGHSQTAPYRFPGSAGPHFLITGLSIENGEAHGTTFEMRYSPTKGIIQVPLPSPNVPRVRHASTRVREGFIGLFGGHQGAQSLPINDAEIFSVEADRFFIFPESGIFLRRFGHTATNLRDGRILLVGGYFSGGQGSAASSIVQIPFL